MGDCCETVPFFLFSVNYTISKKIRCKWLDKCKVRNDDIDNLLITYKEICGKNSTLGGFNVDKLNVGCFEGSVKTTLFLCVTKIFFIWC